MSSEHTQSAQEASGSTLPAAFLRATKLRVSMLIVFILPCAIGPLAAPANLILGWRLKLGRFFCDHLCDHLLRLLAAGAAAAQPPEAAHPRGRPELFLLRPRPLQTASPNRKQKPLSSPTGIDIPQIPSGKKIYLEAPPKQAWCGRAKVRAGSQSNTALWPRPGVGIGRWGERAPRYVAVASR